MLIFGKNVLKETKSTNIKKVYLNKNKKDIEVFQYVVTNKIPYELVDNHELDRMVDGNHQGVVLEIDDFLYAAIDDVLEESFVLLLDHIEDPHNFGAIIRTAEASGINFIIIPKDRSVKVNSTVVKTSSGAITHVNIVLVANIHQTIQKLQKNNFFVYAADMVGTDYHKCDFSGKKALVIGNEGFGVSDLVKKTCDEIVSIPMNGSVNSLNASVATGILIFAMIGESNGI